MPSLCCNSRLLSDLSSRGNDPSSPTFATCGLVSGNTTPNTLSVQYTSCKYALEPVFSSHTMSQRTPSASTRLSPVKPNAAITGSASRRLLNQPGSFASHRKPSTIVLTFATNPATTPKLTSSPQTLVQSGTPQELFQLLPPSPPFHGPTSVAANSRLCPYISHNMGCFSLIHSNP